MFDLFLLVDIHTRPINIRNVSIYCVIIPCPDKYKNRMIVYMSISYHLKLN